MKLYSQASNFEAKLQAEKSQYQACSFVPASTPTMCGRKWQYIGELQGTLTEKAYKALKIRTLLKILFSLGIALCIKSVRKDLETIQSSVHKKIKPIYIAISPDPARVIDRMRDIFNVQIQSPPLVTAQPPLLPKTSKEEVLATEKLSLTKFPAFNDDKDVVRKAVLINYSEFELASDRLKDDKDFVLELLSLNEYSRWIIKYASPRLQDDDRVAAKAMELWKGAYPHLGPTQKKQRSFISAGLEYDALGTFASMPQESRKDKTLAKLAFIKNPTCYIHFDEDLKKDKPFLLDAIKTCNDPHQCKQMYDCLPKELEEDIDFKNALLSKNITINDDGTYTLH